MDVLSFLRTSSPGLLRLPSGSFTVSRAGDIFGSTVPSAFPPELVRDIAQQVVATFREAEALELPLVEQVVHFSSFKITAREVRDGAIVFLLPQTPISPTQ
jgi:hypothetical protein